VSDVAWAKGMKTEVLVHRVQIVASGSLSTLDFIGLRACEPWLSGKLGRCNPNHGLRTEREAPSSSVIDVNIPAPSTSQPSGPPTKQSLSCKMAGQLPEQDWTVDDDPGICPADFLT